MTAREIYSGAVRFLREHEVPDAETDARLLFEKASGVNLTSALSGLQIISEDTEEVLPELLERRAQGEPLQYIIGSWGFMGFDFFVGEGVLIPRSETERLVEITVEKLKSLIVKRDPSSYGKPCEAGELNKPGVLRNVQHPVVYDLCSGSGCIGLSIKKLVPQARVFLVEKSPEALSYLCRNREAMGMAKTVTVVRGDITGGYSFFSSLPKPDVVVSNPPYVASAEIPLLQCEVRQEPEMALDGGADGLDFYPCLCEKWFPSISAGGFMALECGEDQAEIIAGMIKCSSETQVLCDYEGVRRFVVAQRDNSIVEVT